MLQLCPTRTFCMCRTKKMCHSITCSSKECYLCYYIAVMISYCSLSFWYNRWFKPQCGFQVECKKTKWRYLADSLSMGYVYFPPKMASFKITISVRRVPNVRVGHFQLSTWNFQLGAPRMVEYHKCSQGVFEDKRENSL